MPVIAENSSTPERKTNAQSVTRALEEWCATLAPGTRIPTRTELMRRFNASERAVLSALDDLRRNGYVTTRQGAGTFVASPKSVVPRQTTPTIVAIASPDHSFYDRALEVLLPLTEGADLSLICRPFVPREGVIPAIEDAAGYLLFGRALAPLATQLQSEGKRVVLVATPAADELFQVPNVRGDQQKGGYLVARHLIELGHRRIAITGSDGFDMRSPRGMGIQKAVNEADKAGTPVQLSFILSQQFHSWKRDASDARRFWEQAAAPTAIAVWNDHESLIFMGFLNYIGIRVPDQVSVVGYDNLPISQQCHPALTTVDGALEAQLQAALDLLTQSQPLNPHQSVVVLPTLTRRDSSALLKPRS
ncbi:GntR family transcriptional regulator [bacterium]|nr:MAG: GntR family transcriptional regulator [bacterium]